MLFGWYTIGVLGIMVLRTRKNLFDHCWAQNLDSVFFHHKSREKTKKYLLPTSVHRRPSQLDVITSKKKLYPFALQFTYTTTYRRGARVNRLLNSFFSSQTSPSRQYNKICILIANHTSPLPPAKVYVIVYSVSIFNLLIIAGISVKLFIVRKIKNKRFTKTAGFFIAPPQLSRIIIVFINQH